MPRLTFPYPPLTDGVLWLRQPRPADAEVVTAACQDPAIQRWNGVPVPYTLQSAHDWIRESEENVAAARRVSLLGVDRAGELLGSFGVPAIDWEAHTAELGYWVAPQARGRGIAARGVWLLRDWLVNYHGMRRLELLVHQDNAPSLRVAEKAGFVDTGERRVAPRTEGATELDYVVYAWMTAS